MEKTNLLKDKKLALKVAKGTIYCWTSIIAADGSYKEEEFNGLSQLSEGKDYIQQNMDKNATKKVFNEAIEILKNYGLDELYSRIKFVFKEIDINIRSHIFYTCLHLACIDRDLANKEIMILQKIYRALQMDGDSVFRLTLLFFQSEFSKKNDT